MNKESQKGSFLRHLRVVKQTDVFSMVLTLRQFRRREFLTHHS